MDPATPPPVLWTFGHGTADRRQLATLLREAGVEAVVDVRTAPGSRRQPDVRRQALAGWLPDAGLAYRWEARLGGFRRAASDTPDVYWRNASFRGYAAYTRHPDFLAAATALLRQAVLVHTAVMCAESLWWRCHRRIIADYAVLVGGVRVRHPAHDGRLSEHRPTAGARVREDGLLVYDRPDRRAGPEG